MTNPWSHVVQAHIFNKSPHAALEVLQESEKRQIYLPQQIYGAVMRSLLTPRSPAPALQSDKVLAWDLFVHSRLVAYPTPSEEMYNLVIRSCADPRDPQPERALDLWVEMQQESKVTPSVQTYEAVILACARVKKYYFEAFRLFREMLQLHQDAVDAAVALDPETATVTRTGYEPTLKILNALLEGTKRNGDLARGRWILAEVIKISRVGAFRPDENTVVGAFHTYAAFRPLLARQDVRTAKAVDKINVAEGRGAVGVDEQVPAAQAQDHLEGELAETREDGAYAATSTPDTPRADLLDVASPSFAPPAGPQTSPEVIREVDRLFDAIVHESCSTAGADQPAPHHAAFAGLRITPPLINAYLSVHMSHARLEDALAIWDNVWMRFPDAAKNGWSYVLALERVAYARSKRERKVASEWLPRLWKGYRALADVVDPGLEAREDLYAVGFSPREVERAWIACIRGFATSGDHRQALRLLTEFEANFPADRIIHVRSASNPLQPKIRSISPLQQREDNVPPHILFQDVAPLHHRLVVDGDLRGVAYIKFLCTRYEAALKRRRRTRVKQAVRKLPTIARVPVGESPK